MKLLATLLLLCSTAAVAATDEWKLADWDMAYVDSNHQPNMQMYVYDNGEIYAMDITVYVDECTSSDDKYVSYHIDDKSFEVWMECDPEMGAYILTPTAKAAQLYIYRAFWYRNSVTICNSVHRDVCVTFSAKGFQNVIETLRSIKRQS